MWQDAAGRTSSSSQRLIFKQPSSMQRSNSGWQVLGSMLAAALFPSMGHADIYKWVDANGQTHYSQRKADAGDARTVELKVPPPPDAPPASPPSTELWRNTRSQATRPQPPSTDRPPRALSDGRDHGTDASRCALARDVLSGAVRHRNGKPTDTYDREVAQNDIKSFCNPR